MEDRLATALHGVNMSMSDIPNLSSAFRFSADLVANGRQQLAASFDGSDPDLDIVAFGSLARYEMTEASDLDYLVVIYGFDRQPGVSRQALKVADQLLETIKPTGPIKPPGSSGVFGKMVSAIDLVEVIGLENDTNRSHTRRILLLEESVSLFKSEKHTHLLSVILRRYLDAKPLGTTTVPRFLLNDLCRYWRTLTVDYQAKTDTFTAHSTRYLKLIMSRKFTFASSVLPLFTLGIRASGEGFDTEKELLPNLVDIFSKPPLVRFIDAATELLQLQPDLEPPIRQALLTVDKVNGLLGDQAWRDALEAEAKLDHHESQPHFREGRDIAEELQRSLETIFFSDLLRRYSQRYLVF